LFNSYFNEENTDLLSCEDAGSTNFLDLLLGDTREESCLDDDWLLGQNTFTQHLEDSSSGTVDDWSLVCLVLVLESGLLGHEGPQLVQVDGGLVEVGVVGVDVEVPHANLTKVSRMVFVKVDSVVMLSSSVSTTSGMLPVLSNSSVSMRHVSSQLPGLLLGGGHSAKLLL